MSEASVEVYVTKDALTTGVRVGVGRVDGRRFHLRGHGVIGPGQWARTHAEAVEQVESMAARRREEIRREDEWLIAIQNTVARGELPAEVST